MGLEYHGTWVVGHGPGRDMVLGYHGTGELENPEATRGQVPPWVKGTTGRWRPRGQGRQGDPLERGTSGTDRQGAPLEGGTSGYSGAMGHGPGTDHGPWARTVGQGGPLESGTTGDDPRTKVLVDIGPREPTLAW